jgi:dolichol-phosphate mannosyltransferase
MAASNEAEPALSVICPAFNEAENLVRFPAELIPVLNGLGRSYEIVVVDDGSADDTAKVAAELGPPVRLIKHDRNRGLGAAIRTGIAAARGELVVTLDTDLTFSPTLIPALLERFDRGDVDFVSGSPGLAGYAKEIPAYRVFVGKAATVVYTLLLGAPVTSVSPIFRLYRRQDLLALDLRAVGFDINAEILFGLIRAKKRFAEIPAPLTQRIHGTSSLNYAREMRRHARLVLRMLRWKVGLGTS